MTATTAVERNIGRNETLRYFLELFASINPRFPFYFGGIWFVLSPSTSHMTVLKNVNIFMFFAPFVPQSVFNHNSLIYLPLCQEYRESSVLYL